MNVKSVKCRKIKTITAEITCVFQPLLNQIPKSNIYFINTGTHVKYLKSQNNQVM